MQTNPKLFSSFFNLFQQIQLKPYFSHVLPNDLMSSTSRLHEKWKLLETSLRERERIVGSLRLELSHLEDLTGQTVALLSGYGSYGGRGVARVPQRPGYESPALSPCHYWSPATTGVSCGRPMMIHPPVHQVVQASKSSPALQTLTARMCQMSGRRSMSPEKRDSPKDPVQTPPLPRPWVHL